MRYLSYSMMIGFAVLSQSAIAQDTCTTYYKKLYEQGVSTQQINKLKKEIAGLGKGEQEAHCASKMSSK